jgi:uncharacterized coiled-coil protein SlyX
MSKPEKPDVPRGRSDPIANAVGLHPLTRDYVDTRVSELLEPEMATVERNRLAVNSVVVAIQRDIAAVHEQLRAIAARLEKLER